MHTLPPDRQHYLHDRALTPIARLMDEHDRLRELSEHTLRHLSTGDEAGASPGDDDGPSIRALPRFSLGLLALLAPITVFIVSQETEALIWGTDLGRILTVMLIIYGVLGDVSIAKLFTAGFIPGFLLAGCFMAWIMIHTALKPEMARFTR